MPTRVTMGLMSAAAILLTTTACGESTTEMSSGADAGDLTSDGCASVSGNITENEEFTAYEDARGHGDEPPLDTRKPTVEDLARVGAPESISGLSAQGIALQQDDLGAVYYDNFDGSINGMDLADFLAKGGAQLSFSGRNGEPPMHETAEELMPKQFLEVQFGAFDGALNWADPMVNGTRPHVAMWSTEASNYRVTADVSATQMVNMTREFVCKG